MGNAARVTIHPAGDSAGECLKRGLQPVESFVRRLQHDHDEEPSQALAKRWVAQTLVRTSTPAEITAWRSGSFWAAC
jgi:hypothetical protein